MDKTTLVDTQIEAGKKLVDALDKSKFKIVGALWFYYPASDEWKLLFASPLVDILGPTRCYNLILTILQDIGLDFQLFTNISVLSPKDKLIQLLKTAIHTDNGISAIRFSRNTINGVFIEDALIYRLSD